MKKEFKEEEPGVRIQELGGLAAGICRLRSLFAR
jgi:hypothetical protein